MFHWNSYYLDFQTNNTYNTFNFLFQRLEYILTKISRNLRNDVSGDKSWKTPFESKIHRCVVLTAFVGCSCKTYVIGQYIFCGTVYSQNCFSRLKLDECFTNFGRGGEKRDILHRLMSYRPSISSMLIYVFLLHLTETKCAALNGASLQVCKDYHEHWICLCHEKYDLTNSYIDMAFLLCYE